jgi:peptidoglycan/LPS O-acetylase OafA/YrhL
MRSKLTKVFSWKHNPESIFYLAIPLAVMGFACMAVVAFLHWRENDDYVYAIIALVGLVLLVAGALPILKAIDQQSKIQKASKLRESLR